MINWKAVYVIWLREILRFWREKPRIITSMAQPAIWLFVMGQGMGSSFRGAGNINYSQFLFPGVLVMTLMFTAVFSGVSVAWDREFGFLREILVAPVSRISIVIGKAAAGSTTAVLQGLLVMLLAPVIGVSLNLTTILLTLAAMLLIAFALAAGGILVAARMDSMQGVQMIMNFIIMPMLFTSGALYPMDGLPAWLRAVALVNPLAYGVDLLKGIVIGMHSHPLALDVAISAILAAAFLFGAMVFFKDEV